MCFLPESVSTERAPARARYARLSSPPCRWSLLLAVALFLSLPIGLGAQQTGTVTGQVTTETGEPLGGATVVVTGARTGALSRDGGRFLVAGVPAGTRTITASMIGYRSVTRSVDVPMGGTVSVELVLEPRPVEVGGIQVSVLRPDLQPQGDLTERQMKRANPKDAGELLRGVTGVDAVRRGPLGMDPVVRGLRETEIGTYVDGSRWFTAGPARMDAPLTHIDPSAVESIQIVKGPYALTWGAGNQGAIKVETRSLPGRRASGPVGSVDVGYDSNLGARETFAGMGGRIGSISFRGQGGWREGGDYQSGDGSVVPGSFESWEARGKVGIDLGERSLLSFSGGYQHQDSLDYPGRLLNANYFHSRNLSTRFETARDQGLLRAFQAELYLNHVDHQMGNWQKPTSLPMEGRMPPFALDVTVDASADVWGGRSWVDLDTEGWEMRVGGDLYSLDRNAVRTIRRADSGMLLFEDLMWPGATIVDGGVYTRLQRGFDSGVRVTGTLRLDLVSADADTISDFFRERVSTDLASTETNLSASTTVGVPLSGRWNLSFGVGSAVRTADATERYSDRVPSSKAQTSAEFVGNPALNPERSTQADIWLEGALTDVAVRLNVFGRRVGDYITLEPTDLPKRLPLSPATVYQYVNGDATFWGAEASTTLGLAETVTADASVSYLWGRDDALDEPALGISPLRGSLSLRYQDPAGRYFAEGTLRAVSEQTRVAAARGEGTTPGYATTDLGLGWAPGGGVSVRLGVQNLLDRQYVNHLNATNPFTGTRIPEPGRVLFLDLSYGF